MADVHEIRDGIAKIDKAITLLELLKAGRETYNAHCVLVEESKKELGELVDKRNRLVAGSCSMTEKKIGEVMTMQPIFGMSDDGSLFIGVSDESGHRIPYRGLSGGERIMFDVAISHAVASDSILVTEAAEVDPKNLSMLMDRLLSRNGQTVICAWTKPETVPEGWDVVEIRNNLCTSLTKQEG